MSIFDSASENDRSVISIIGDSISDIISVPLDFVKDIAQTPFNFVRDTVGGIGTKIVLIVGLAIIGIYVVGKYNILKDLK